MFQPVVFIHPFEGFLWVILDYKDVVNENKYALVLLESVVIYFPWYHTQIGVNKAHIVSHLFHTISQMIPE